MCEFSSGSLYPAVVLVLWGAQTCSHPWNKFSKLLPRELHHEPCLDPDQRPSVGQGGFFDFALDWSTGDGLELLRAGEQQEAAQPLHSCSFLGHCSSGISQAGWSSWSTIPHPWFHTCLINCGPEPNSARALQRVPKLAGPGWVSKGRKAGDGDEKHKRGESWRPKRETELKNDQSPRYKHPVNSVLLF